MAVSTVTITITNTKKKPTVLGAAAIDTTVISPTGITTPDTPYTEYVADSLTVTDGALDLPLYPRGQITKLPAASILTIQTDDYNEAEIERIKSDLQHEEQERPNYVTGRCSLGH